jgi:hypothetical protein
MSNGFVILYRYTEINDDDEIYVTIEWVVHAGNTE